MTVSLHHGDCLDVLSRVEAESADSFITDPPYCSGGVTEAGRGTATHQGLRSETIRKGRFEWFDGDVMTTPGLVWLLRSVAVEDQRILKPTGHLMVFADWRMVPMLAPAIESAGLRYRSMIVWDKGSMGCGLGFRPQHEIILHFTGRAPAFHAANVGNVIRCPRVHTNKRVHPTEKPLDLLKALIRVTTPPDGLAIDPFAGSGSLGVAAQQIGRRSLLIERGAEIYADMAERLSAPAGDLLASAS